jgi:restriction system protein
MAKSRGLLADLQRELARRQRAEQQRIRIETQAAARAKREHEQALQKAARDAAATEKEHRRLYVEERKAEAASQAASLQARISELDSVLTSGVRQRPLVAFSSLRRSVTYPAFNADGLDRPLPAPRWEQFAPPPPSGLGKVFGGTARRERQEAAAHAAYESERARHAAAEADRRRKLAQRRAAYDAAASAAASAAQAHNEGVDQLERDFLGREPEAVAEFCALALGSSVYPEGFALRTRVLYRPDPRKSLLSASFPRSR